MIRTVIDVPISEEMVSNYLQMLVNHFFKILPIREEESETLPVYMKSLQLELIGCKEFVSELKNDSSFLTLLSILQYLRDHPDCPVKDVKREVFKAITICNKMKDRYCEEG